MVDIFVLSLLLVVHFIADFVLQTRWMGRNKSSNWQAMAAHIAVYTICLIPFGLLFAIVNGLLHLITDIISSRLTSKFYREKREAAFWAVIGADQLAHVLALIWTLYLIG